MSVIAVKKNKNEIIIGADSIRMNGYMKTNDESAKLSKIDKDMIVGSSGYCDISMLFKNFLLDHKPKSATENGYIRLIDEFIDKYKYTPITSSKFIYKYTSIISKWLYVYGWRLNSLANRIRDFGFSDSEFIIIYNKKVFFISGYFVKEIKDYYAIGVGKNYAMSCLYAGCSVQKAIETACHFSIYCEKPINIITIKL